MQGGKGLLVAGTALLVLAAAAGVFLWSRMHNVDGAGQPGAQEQNVLAQPALRDEPLMATLYYPAGDLLTPVSAALKRRPDAQSQAREAILSLFADQRAAQAAGLAEVKLRALYLDAAGVAYLDLALAAQKDVKASAWEELLALYALVNTLTQNFEEIKQVRFLLNGREAQTLAGHLDLTGAFAKRMDLVRQ
jgi:hypothetical protein